MFEGMGGTGEMLLRLSAATIAGAAVGTNRELTGKPAGMRTHALVALGAALVTLSSMELASRGPVFDGNMVTRSVQGIVAGVGFLGGGVILKMSERATVRGLTTAATIWVVACLGIACGMGQWSLALAAVILTLVVLWLGRKVENVMKRRMREHLHPRDGAAPEMASREPGQR